VRRADGARELGKLLDEIDDERGLVPSERAREQLDVGRSRNPRLDLQFVQALA